jgi:hypothetical protein
VVFDVEIEDFTDVLRDVLDRHAPAEVTVAGATGTGAPGCWTCNCYPVRWMLRDELVRQVVVGVESTAPTDTALSVEDSASSELGA